MIATHRDMYNIDADFVLLTPERAVSDHQALGLPLHYQYETPSTLFLGGYALLTTYVQVVIPCWNSLA